MIGLDTPLSNGAALPIGFGAPAPMSSAEYVRCVRCGFGGCDLRVSGCGCSLHVRCTGISADGPLKCCPSCRRETTGLVLFPMSFREVDEARRTSASLSNNGKRGRKRKSTSITQNGEDSDQDKSGGGGGGGGGLSGRRTGRWTSEEMAYCDELIAKFKDGMLPLVDGVKLNEFLANMLKSKQSRLTKKMKNAKLSSKTFSRAAGYIVDPTDAQRFSRLEESFFHSILCQLERAEIKFHMQREWRELFSSYCMSVGQPLDADAWLSSVEEMDRRESMARDAARMARRKLMMGYALSQDTRHAGRGVFIEQTEEDRLVAAGAKADADLQRGLAMKGDGATISVMESLGVSAAEIHSDMNGKSSLLHAAPFLIKIVNYMKRHNVPFEHIDAWVPSFVAGPDGGEDGGEPGQQCRLCYAGSATTEVQVPPDGAGPPQPLSQDDLFNLMAFGDYSQKFSFDVGFGLPGRVYQSGVPTWEQSVQNAPHQHFERCGGAVQWGIKTVVGIPVPSPNVGRVVVTLYSRHDRAKDPELVGRLCEEFARHMPSPKWKLVVDIGLPAAPKAPAERVASSNASVTASTTDLAASSALEGCGGRDARIDEVVALLGEHMPSDPSSPVARYLPGFMSLRLMLLRPSRSDDDEELVRTMMGSYASYTSAGRTKNDIALMMARDYMFLTQSSQQQQQSSPVLRAQAPPPAIAPPPVPQAVQMTQQQNVAAHAHAPPVHFYGAPPADFVYKNSPALTPIIPSSGILNNDSASIVST